MSTTGQRRIHWGFVKQREYARDLSSGGIPEGEPGCKFPLGISDVVIVRDETGDITHGIDVQTGSTVDGSRLGVSVKNGESSKDTPSEAGSSASAASGTINEGATAAVVSASASEHVSSGASASTNSSGALKPGERLCGTVDSYDQANAKRKADRLAELLKGKGGKKGVSMAMIAALQAKGAMQDWHPDGAKGRHKLLLEQPSLVSATDLTQRAEALSAEYTAICKGRHESNAGCRCGALSREELNMCKKEDLQRECKLRGIATVGKESKKQLVDKLAQQSSQHLGCTSRMHALMDKLEAMESELNGNRAKRARTEALVVEEAAAGQKPSGDGQPANGTAGHADGAVRRPGSPPSPSSASSSSSDDSGESIKSMSETREDEVNARLQRLVDSLPPGASLPEDPRQRKAFVRAFLLAEDLKEELKTVSEAASTGSAVSGSTVAASKPVSTCPCEAEGIGCHYNTCACDPDHCDNRHLWEPSSAVYADRVFELHRAAVHFLNASWVIAYGTVVVGADGVPRAADAMGLAGALLDSKKEGGAAASSNGGPGTVIEGANAAGNKDVLYLPGGKTRALPSPGMPKDGPFFTDEQVLFTMKTVEELLTSAEGEGEDDEAGLGLGLGEGGELDLDMDMDETLARIQEAVGMGSGDMGEDEEEAVGRASGRGGRGPANRGSLTDEASDADGHDDADHMSVDSEGHTVEAGAGAGGGKAGKRGRKGKGEKDTSTAGAAGAAGAGGIAAAGAGSASSSASEGSTGSAKRSGRKRKASEAASDGSASASSETASAGHGHAHAHGHGHGQGVSHDHGHGVSRGVTQLEHGLIQQVYSDKQLKSELGATSASDRSLFPVSTVREGHGVLSVWSTVRRMPEAALSRIAAKEPRGESEGILSTLAWIECKHRAGTPASAGAGSSSSSSAGGAAGPLADVMQALADGKQDVAGSDAAWLADRLRTYMSPPDGAAVLRGIMRLLMGHEPASPAGAEAGIGNAPSPAKTGLVAQPAAAIKGYGKGQEADVDEAAVEAYNSSVRAAAAGMGSGSVAAGKAGSMGLGVEESDATFTAEARARIFAMMRSNVSGGAAAGDAEDEEDEDEDGADESEAADATAAASAGAEDAPTAAVAPAAVEAASNGADAAPAEGSAAAAPDAAVHS